MDTSWKWTGAARRFFPCAYIHCVPKSDAKIQITITTAQLIRITYPLRSFNYRLSGINVVNFNKIHHMVSEQQLLKMELKTIFFLCGKIPISILTAGSVTNNDIMLVTFFVTRLVNVKSNGFYRAAWNADAVLRWDFCPSVCPSVRLYVCPSVCQTRALWQNGRKLC